jgi:hypothetical protein
MTPGSSGFHGRAPAIRADGRRATKWTIRAKDKEEQPFYLVFDLDQRLSSIKIRRGSIKQPTPQMAF